MSQQPYKKLFTYWYAVIIYDHTVEFCNRWIKSYKLSEQMTGAGRSGKQNIVEGSDSLKTSMKSGIKLTNVAKASEEELLEDYEDFLRQRGLNVWPKDDKRVLVFRAKAAKLVKDLSNLSDLSKLRESTKLIQEKLPLPEDPEEAANLMLTLCHQITYLLNRQVESLEHKHEKEGGYTEKLYKRRRQFRGY